MLLVPVLFNTVCFWLTDSYIKHQAVEDNEPIGMRSFPEEDALRNGIPVLYMATCLERYLLSFYVLFVGSRTQESGLMHSGDVTAPLLAHEEPQASETVEIHGDEECVLLDTSHAVTVTTRNTEELGAQNTPVAHDKEEPSADVM